MYRHLESIRCVLMKRFLLIALFTMAASLLPAPAQNPPAKSAPPESTVPNQSGPGAAKADVLPQAFGGWQKSGSQSSSDPASADPTHPALLKEYGFRSVETATYTKPERSITVRAATFDDTSGAYGAFTFYKTPEMLTEKFGDQGATFNNRILFYRGNVLIDVTLDRITAMTAAELRELGEDVPLPPGSARNPPLLPSYLPKQGYVKNSAKYVEGPVGLQSVDAPLPANAVDFAKGAEIALGKYATDGGNATMVLIGYPTPQIAAEQEKSLENFHPANGTTFLSRRTGPILAVMAGPISPSEAKALLGSVNYDADITWNQNTFFTKKDNVANLLVNVVLLIGIILVFAIMVGVLMGGVKVLNRKLFPDRGFDRDDRNEFISLHLRD